MFYQDEEKIECALGNRDFGFLAGQESRQACCFYFWCRDSQHLFVSDTWYCQITRLIMFFGNRIRERNSLSLSSLDNCPINGPWISGCTMEKLVVEHNRSKLNIYHGPIELIEYKILIIYGLSLLYLSIERARRHFRLIVLCRKTILGI